MHRLIDKFYKGKLCKSELPIKFLMGFQEEVKGERPPGETVQRYITQGIDYLSNIEPLPFHVVATEKQLFFEIDGVKFTGVIDYLGERDGDLYIVDHKSRDMKPRSGRKRPTAKDAELDEMLTQLYLYAEAVRQEYGVLPKALCFNCFRTGVFIEEPFEKEAFDAAVRKVLSDIRYIEDEEDFPPRIEYFACRNICGVHSECCYYDRR